MPTTTMANRRYFENAARTTESATKRRKMVSMASLETQATVKGKANASANETLKRARNLRKGSFLQRLFLNFQTP
jgi:predicted GIY-YIG superfamily endonuclease